MSTRAELAAKPVHGFVLAGGKSSRMGRDKALLPFCGTSLVEIALRKLRAVCSDVAILGNRQDLARMAPVVEERLSDAGPVAGIEAGLFAAAWPWALFLPVDVPLLPVDVLDRWLTATVQASGHGVAISYLRAGGEVQPAICLLHRDCSAALSAVVGRGERKLERIFAQVAAMQGGGSPWIANAEDFATAGQADRERMSKLFSNLNRPEDIAELEAWVKEDPAERRGECMGWETVLG